jgi:hypothetical protein
MSRMMPVTRRKPRPLGLKPWVSRHRGDLADTARFMTAMAIDDAGQGEEPNTEHRIEIEPTHYTSTGARYRVTCLGETLIESARDPEFEACRALLAKGIKGTLVTYSPGSSVPRMKVDIEKGAMLTVIESAREGPRFARYRPHPSSAEREDAE